MNEVLVDELIHEHFAHAFDIHGTARGEVADGAFQLGWTGDVFTAPRDELGIARNGAFAHRTFAVEILVEFELLSLTRSLLRHADDRRDDLSCFLNDNRVADLDFLSLD